MLRKLELYGKVLFTLLLCVIILIACSNPHTQAGKDEATYLESVDNYNTFDAIVIVHKETGCKYLYTSGSRKGGVVQMLDKDGKPYCD